MPATNYTKPANSDYQLVRIKGKQAEIIDPVVLGKILSILELHECSEGQTDRPLWDALYRSQPFHSAQVDPTAEYWLQGHPHISAHERSRMFPWAASRGQLAA
jgi:hypothetical protein